jgi:outer membrane autotransporter protein
MSTPSFPLALGEVEGQTTLQSNTGNAVQTVCMRQAGNISQLNTVQMALQATCTSMVQNAVQLEGATNTPNSRNLDATSLNSGIQNISTEEIALTGQTTARTSNAQVVTAMARIQELLGGGGGFRVAALDEVKGETVFAYTPGGDSDYGVRGGAAGSDDPSRFGGFINIIGSFGDKDETSREAGFDFDTVGVQAGLDYRLTDNFVFGGAFGYSHLNSDFKQSVNVDGGGVDADSYGFSLFGLYYLENFYFHGLAGYARNEYDVKRKVFIASQDPNQVVDATGKSSPDANTYLISGGGGYDFTYDAWTLGPIVRADYIHSDIGSYNESGAGALNLRVQSQTIKSLTTHVGAQTSYSQSTKFGILSPYVRATWVHEFENDGRFIRSFYINEFVPAGESATILPVESEDPDRDYGRLSLGLSGVFPHGFQGFLQYERWVGLDDINDNVFTLGFRGEF